MTAMRRVGDLLQVKGCPTEVLQGLAQVERQLLHYKLEAKQAKQVTIEHFFKGETRSESQAGAAVVEVDLEAEEVDLVTSKTATQRRPPVTPKTSTQWRPPMTPKTPSERWPPLWTEEETAFAALSSDIRKS